MPTQACIFIKGSDKSCVCTFQKQFDQALCAGTPRVRRSTSVQKDRAFLKSFLEPEIRYFKRLSENSWEKPLMRGQERNSQEGVSSARDKAPRTVRALASCFESPRRDIPAETSCISRYALAKADI